MLLIAVWAAASSKSIPVQKRPGVPAITRVRQPAIRSARSRAAPISRINVELMLFPLPGREIVTTSCRGASWTVIVSNCSYLSPKSGKDLHTTLVRELTLRLILSRERLPRFQVPRFEIQRVTFPN